MISGQRCAKQSKNLERCLVFTCSLYRFCTQLNSMSTIEYSTTSPSTYLVISRLVKRPLKWLLGRPFLGVMLSWVLGKSCSISVHIQQTDLDGPIVSKESLILQNWLQFNKKCLEFIVRYSPCPLLSTF